MAKTLGQYGAWVGLWVVWLNLVSCSSPPSNGVNATRNSDLSDVQWLNRITWGANDASLAELARLGRKTYLDKQLHPDQHARLPPAIAADIDAMQISQKSMLPLSEEAEQLRKLSDQVPESDRQNARKNHQQFLNELSHETAQRFMLRAVYSPNQLQEQLTWFWFNHFSVNDRKNDIRALVGDYEENAIRPHVLGRFRDLLAATVYHPAMLIYLDNEKNALGHVNENYARELMELHTLGVDGGYSQQDVQELARVLTGLGVQRNQQQHFRAGHNSHRENHIVNIGDMVVFNARKHDANDKQFLGEAIHSQGKAEIDEVINRLSHHPATAHFISRKLAMYFLEDEPSPAVVDRMATTFLARDGDISATLRTLFTSEEFNQSLDKKFKDPVHYVVSALRFTYADNAIQHVMPAVNALEKLGEPLYAHPTPDGYSLVQTNWASPGQMTMRFEVAHNLGSQNLSVADSEKDKFTLPLLKESAVSKIYVAHMSLTTQQALLQTHSSQEWNSLFFSAPEFMTH